MRALYFFLYMCLLPHACAIKGTSVITTVLKNNLFAAPMDPKVALLSVKRLMLQRFFNLQCLKKLVCDETQLVFRPKRSLVVTLNLLEFWKVPKFVSAHCPPPPSFANFTYVQTDDWNVTRRTDQ